MEPIYRSERVTLYQQDCLEALRALPSESVDAIVADPPYSSGGLTQATRNADPRTKYQVTGTKRQYPSFSGDNRDQRSYLLWCTLWLSQCLRVAKSGAPILVFTDWRQLPTTSDALQAGGWIWRGVVPWDKTEGARPDKGRFRHQCEYVIWGSKGQISAPPDAPCHPGLFRVPVRQSDKFHLTGKPTELLQKLLEICPPGGLVLDPFAGSGTTGVAALRTGRRFLGIELSEAYCEIARQRLEAELPTASS